MNGLLLRCYLHEDQRHGGELAWESLMSHAMKTGISGASAFQSMAGFGHHHVLHDGAGFFKKATRVIEVEFLVTQDQADELLRWMQAEGISAFYARLPARFDMTGGATGAADAAPATPPLAGPGA